MQLSDDAEGRVMIFSVEEDAAPAVVRTPDPGAAEGGARFRQRVGEALDSPQAPIVLAVVLVVILVLGLLLGRH